MYADKYNIEVYNDEVQKIKDVANLFSSIKERVSSVGGNTIILSSSGVHYSVDDLGYVVEVLNNCAENSLDIYKFI